MIPSPQMPQGQPTPPEVPPGPQASPMAQPSPNDGARQKGLASVQAAADTLSMALADLGSMTPEGQAVVSALKALSKFTSATGNELVPAQLMDLFRAQQPSPMTQMIGGAGAPAAPAPQPA